MKIVVNFLFYYNMSKLIPHFSNHQKIVFWPWSGVKWGKINMFHKIKKFSNVLMNHFSRNWVKIPKFDNYHPPYHQTDFLGFFSKKNYFLLHVYFRLTWTISAFNNHHQHQHQLPPSQKLSSTSLLSPALPSSLT